VAASLLQKARVSLVLLEEPHLNRVVIFRLGDKHWFIRDENDTCDSSATVRCFHLGIDLFGVQIPQDYTSTVSTSGRHETELKSRVSQEANAVHGSLLLCECEEDFIVEEVDEVDGSVGTSYSDHINHWTLNYTLNLTFEVEGVDLLLLDDIPQFKCLATTKD